MIAFFFCAFVAFCEATVNMTLIFDLSTDVEPYFDTVSMVTKQVMQDITARNTTFGAGILGGDLHLAIMGFNTQPIYLARADTWNSENLDAAVRNATSKLWTVRAKPERYINMAVETALKHMFKSFIVSGIFLVTTGLPQTSSKDSPLLIRRLRQLLLSQSQGSTGAKSGLYTMYVGEDPLVSKHISWLASDPAFSRSVESFGGLQDGVNTLINAFLGSGDLPVGNPDAVRDTICESPESWEIYWPPIDRALRFSGIAWRSRRYGWHFYPDEDAKSTNTVDGGFRISEE